MARRLGGKQVERRSLAALLLVLGMSGGCSWVAAVSDAAAAHGVDPRLVANLALLRKPVTPGTRITRVAGQPLSGGPAALVVSAARAVHLRYLRTEVGVIPGRRGVCLQILGGGYVGYDCQGVPSFLEQYGDFQTEGGGVVAGVFTDAARRVELLAPSGAHRRLLLKLGAFAGRYGARHCFVITGADGSRKVLQIGAPLSGACAKAAGLPEPKSTNPTVAPAAGGPRSVFTVKLTSRARLGVHRGILTEYVLLTAGESTTAPASGCTFSKMPVIARGHPGQHITVVLRPYGSGWCQAAYTAPVLLERGPVCKSLVCPQPLQSGPDGTVSWTVTPPPGSAATPGR